MVVFGYGSNGSNGHTADSATGRAHHPKVSRASTPGIVLCSRTSNQRQKINTHIRLLSWCTVPNIQSTPRRIDEWRGWGGGGTLSAVGCWLRVTPVRKSLYCSAHMQQNLGLPQGMEVVFVPTTARAGGFGPTKGHASKHCPIIGHLGLSWSHSRACTRTLPHKWARRQISPHHM